MAFVYQTHTPLAESKSYETNFIDIPRDAGSMTTLQYWKDKIRLTESSLPIFRILLTKASSSFLKNRKKSYASLIEQKEIPKKYKFSYGTLNGLIVIGKLDIKDDTLLKKIKNTI